MANTILSSALSAPSLTVTSDQTSINVASGCGVSKVVIKLRSKVFRHKREDGTTIVDARVLEPMVTEIDVFSPSLDSLTLLNSAMLDRNSTYTLKSRGLVLRNMMVNETSIKQTGDMISASPVRLSFKELLTQNQSSTGQTNVAQAADSTLIDKGLQTVSSAVQSVQSLASSIAASAASAVSKVVNGSLLDGNGNTFFLDTSELQ
jgi:hypothetical protein